MSIYITLVIDAICSTIDILAPELEQAFKMFPNEFKNAYGVDMPSKDDDNVVLYSSNGLRSLGALAVLGEQGFNKLVTCIYIL